MSFRKRFRYKFETLMGRGGKSIFLSLTLVFVLFFLALSLLRGILVHWFPDLATQWENLDFWSHTYLTFLQLTDPGNMVQDLESSPWYKVFAVLSGLVGVIMLSSLIAFITTGIDQKLSELKRGHSKVIEEDHTLILGWDEQRVIEILKELIMANESEDDACVVILANEDKEEMDDLITLRLPNQATTRIVTRSGKTSSLANLDIVSVEHCKSMIILANCDDMGTSEQKASSDAKVIQTILALSAKKGEDEDFCIVTEIFNPSHRKIIENSFPNQVVAVDTGDILAKLMVQTSRSVGLSVVYSEILSFDGCEMYFHQADWKGIRFKDLGYRFPDGVPMGIRHADGSLDLNPDITYELVDDDEILILADDDSTIEFCEKPVAKPERQQLPSVERMEPIIERELLLGWTPKVPTIVEQYADYVEDGSQIDIIVRNPSDEIRQEIRALDEKIPGTSIRVAESDPLHIEDLLSLEPFKYDDILLLAEGGGEKDPRSVDSENIVTLLLLRDIFGQYPEESANTKLITEVLDSQNHHLISNAGVKDVIISNQLVSMILAQISESRGIRDVYDDIFEEDGSEIYLKPASLYFDAFPVEVSFATLMDLTQQRQEVCLGIKIQADEDDPEANFGVDLIPEKSSLIKLTAEDSLVVLSEDEF
ncbi:MAG: hypothetical protein CMH55_03175 [Myxococcales bacterium]|nr:hypothetical protein [Myxococcales bacterium]